MAFEAGRRGHGSAAAPSPWSFARAAGTAAAGAAALAAVYLRGREGPVSALVSPWAASSPPAPGPVDVYCYESVLTLAQDPPAPPGPFCFRVQDGLFHSVVSRDADDPDIVAAAAAAAAAPLPGHVIPGLWDGHGHLIPYGEFLASVDLFGATDAADVRRRLEQYLALHPGAGQAGTWLRGFGWDQMAMGGVMPTAELLASPALSGLYIMLDRVDGHCVWISDTVLDLLPPDLDDIPGGEIVREPGLGVFCDNAMTMVTDQWPRPDAAAKAEYIRLAMREMRSLGLVGMHDAGVVPEDLQLYRELAGGGADWTLRVYALVECPARNAVCADAVAARLRKPGQPGAEAEAEARGFLSVRSVKLFADGALGSWGSAMLEPYSDRPDTAGSLLVDADTLTRRTRDWAAAGFQVSIHAIGDLANRNAVDAFEAALVDLCPAAGEPLAVCQHARFRFRIEHAQIVHPHDQARIHALGLVPSVQPTHATSDMAYAARRLGPNRTRDEAYRMRSFLHGHEHGGPGHGPASPLVLGSDFPIEPPDPFQGIYAAVARRSPRTGRGADGSTPDAWYPAEALTRAEALAGFTKGAAYGAFLDGRAGVIQAGAFADWVVLDKPVDAYDLEDFRSMAVRETWVAGRRVYTREKNAG